MPYTEQSKVYFYRTLLAQETPYGKVKLNKYHKHGQFEGYRVLITIFDEIAPIQRVILFGNDLKGALLKYTNTLAHLMHKEG